jgi:uncharacterized protein (DUF1501 family)
MTMLPQNLGCERVEGCQKSPVFAGFQQPIKARSHFPSRLVSEGHSKDPKTLTSGIVEKAYDAISQHASLS